MALDAVALKTLAIELASALPPPSPSESDFAFAPLDNSPRAIQERSIVRIARRHGWEDAITHFMDMKGAAYLSDLTDPQIDDLAQRMEGYVDAAECGHYLPDSFPAT